jgi:hypothetical protein
LVLYQAVQSLDDEVLRNIDRANIKLDSYEKMQVHVRGRGLRSTSDLILGLPGESLQTHLRGLYKLIDAGTHQAHCFQAMMLKGAELETVATRERFKFDTRFRVLPKNFGIYGGEKVFDIEEIIVTTDTLPFEDYVTCREHHLIFSVFWNDSWFSDVVDVAERSGIKRSEWLMNMLGDTGVVRELRDDFVAETVGELFETREACRDFYADDANFERLCRGEIGDNLMYKYRARASFFLWKEICEAGMRRTLMQLQERAPETRTEAYAALWKDFATYTEARHAHGIRVEQILAPVVVELAYDIPSWLGEGTPTDVGPYRFDSPRRFLFSLTEEGAREIEAALNVWTSQLAGLTKLVTRIRVASQVRECRPVLHEPSTLGTGVA